MKDRYLRKSGLEPSTATKPIPIQQLEILRVQIYRLTSLSPCDEGH